MAQSVARQAVNLQVAGSNPAGGDLFLATEARLAQSVARGSHNPKVVSSILAPRTYIPFVVCQNGEAPEGFEPSTLRLLGVRSNQLSYGAHAGLSCTLARAIVPKWSRGWT